MNRSDRGLRLHDRKTYMGWIAGPQAHALSYWTMRLADELEGVGRYEVAYQNLREITWENIRPFNNNSNAVSVEFPILVRDFMNRNAERFSAKYGQCMREIAVALNNINSASAITGRTSENIAA